MKGWVDAATLDAARAANGILAVPTFARPVVVPASDLPIITADLRLVHSAITKLVLGGARVKLSDEVADLARESISRGEGLGFTRYDVVYGEGHRDFKIIECQAGDPSGAGWCDAFAETLQAPGHRRFRIVEALAQLIRSRMPEVARPAIAFVVARDSFVRSDHALMARGCQALGLDCRLADVRELTRTSAGLFAGTARLDLCVRDTIDELVPGSVLLGAWRDRVVEVLNPFAAIVADDKTLFEALSTGEGDFTADERAALARRIPWTRVLTARRRADVLARRDALVLKPADGYGGFGISIGCEHDAAGWEAKVDAALQGHFVVQQYVPLPEEEFPQRLKLVGSFWWVNDQFAGGFHRAAATRVINVHQGGGLVPTFFADS